jgi:hypothetical protein
MFGDDENSEGFDDVLRSIARELGQSVERAIDNVDLDEIASTFGVDPAAAREWIESAGSWFRSHAESLGDEMPFRPGGGAPGGGAGQASGGAGQASGGAGSGPGATGRAPTGPAGPGHGRAGEDPLFSAGPHPLDLPTDEQGMALAALESGRWMVEPGTDALAARGGGPGPSDALGIVRELRVRDWLSADGEITLVGRHALSRWLDAATPPKG